MDELISRQAAIAMCRKPCMRNADCSDFEMEIMMLPSVQPEIVRCKDCKHWDTTWQNDYAPNYHYCPMIDGTRRNDFYCAYAERKEETT